MAKPSKRRWAVEKRARRVLAQRDKAQRVANRLMGGRVSAMGGKYKFGLETATGNYQWFCEKHTPKS